MGLDGGGGMKTQSKIMRRVVALMVFVTLTLVSTLGLAELRVVIEYNSVEHKLMRLVEINSTHSGPVSDHLGATQSQDSAKLVKLRWFGADGLVIGRGSIEDPRLTHAPLTDSVQAPSVIGLVEGAYVVSGPIDSTLLEIQLPANSALGLEEQVWQIVLNR